MNGRPGLSIIESIRKRPVMFLGTTNSYGIRRLLKVVISEYLEGVTGIHTIEVTFNPDNHISIVISGLSTDELEHEIALLHHVTSPKNYKIGMLIGVSKVFLSRIVSHPDRHVLAAQAGTFELSAAACSPEETDVIKLDFQLDEEIFKDSHASYIPMNIMLQQLAYLNAGLKIISVDNRGELQRNVFYFKKGIKELFNNVLEKHDYGKKDSWLAMELKTAINGYIYHIIFRYHYIYTNYPAPYVRAFANNDSTKSGGSLIDGVFKGLQDAFKAIGEKEGVELKAPRKKIGRQLVLMASVKGEPLVYAGNSKDKLDMRAMKSDVRKYVGKVVYKHLLAHTRDRRRVLERFKKD
ncbi:DNA topoisomerase subunit B [Chitinophaga ginsengisoli]|nr:hypothetical protein [Chitinophaga ginsengisoli]